MRKERTQHRMVRDLCAITEATVFNTHMVPNPHTFLAQVPVTSTHSTVIDFTKSFLFSTATSR